MGEEVTVLPCWGCGRPGRKYPYDEMNESICCTNIECTVYGEVYEKNRWNKRATYANGLRLRADKALAEVAKLKEQINDIYGRL